LLPERDARSMKVKNKRFQHANVQGVTAILRPNAKLNEDLYFDTELGPIRVAVRTSGAPHRHAHGEERSVSGQSEDLVFAPHSALNPLEVRQRLPRQEHLVSICIPRFGPTTPVPRNHRTPPEQLYLFR
jgi:hypothetical protein